MKNQNIKPKILVVGFQRSGTTLLRRIVEYHPDVIRCFHEHKILKKGDIKEYLVKRKIKMYGDIWGEKVPWFNATANGMINYCKRWLDLFGDDARILHIKRNKDDVAASNMRLHKAPSRNAVIDMHAKSLPKMKEAFKKEKRYLEIAFEDLVTNTFDTCVAIFDFCGLDSSEETIKHIISPGKKKWKYFDSINPERAFAYKRK